MDASVAGDPIWTRRSRLTRSTRVGGAAPSAAAKSELACNSDPKSSGSRRRCGGKCLGLDPKGRAMDALARGRGELGHGSLGTLLLPAGPVPAIFEAWSGVPSRW
jgi:hypothetical protein